MNSSTITRRAFLEFLGSASLTAVAAPLAGSFLAGCASTAKPSREFKQGFIQASDQDSLILAEGFHSRVLLKWKDSISPKGLQFGNNNDFCAFVPKDPASPTDGMLMVNHEFVNPLFVSGFDVSGGKSKTKAQVDMEQDSVGVSLVRFYKKEGDWLVDVKSDLNRRITAKTEIPFSSRFPIEGKNSAQGTLANCAGGTTPWGTFLTCEENYDQFYGEWDYSPKSGEGTSRKSPKRTYVSKDLSWTLHQDLPPTHYGWVVEINPWTGAAKKLTALGRFCHESATCTRAQDGRAVVYMGDDTANQFLYKFISDTQTSLEHGTLYVAHLESGRWLPIKMDSHPAFLKRFKNETDLSTRTREAAALLGATPLDRPEDIEINPANGDVIVALTNNPLKNNLHGSLLKVRELDADAGALKFESSTWISGGPECGLSCPDNLVFDRSGNLWCTNDIADDKMNQGPYKDFKNNGLYFIPMHGSYAGSVFQVASAPRDAELTGPMFTPDGETLLFSVQHPGEQTTNLDKPTSHWPDGSGQMPRSAIVSVSGEGLRRLVNYQG
jgi:hypothetical protein